MQARKVRHSGARKNSIQETAPQPRPRRLILGRVVLVRFVVFGVVHIMRNKSRVSEG